MSLRLKTLLASSLATLLLVTGLSVGLYFLLVRQMLEAEKITLNTRLDQAIWTLFSNKGVLADDSVPSPLESGPPPGGGPPQGGGPPPDGPEPAKGSEPPRPDLLSSQQDADVLAILTPTGQILPAPTELLQGKSSPLSPELQETLTHLPSHWATLTPGKALSLRPGCQVGLLRTTDGLLLLSESPWSSPSYPGQALRLITVSHFSSTSAHQIGHRAQLMLSLLPLDDPHVPASFRDTSPTVSRIILEQSPTAISTQPLENQRDKAALAGYILLRDVQGNPAAALEGATPTPFVEHGKEAARALITFVWIIGLAFGVTMNLLLDRWVLSRLSGLSGQLQRIQGGSNLDAQVDLPGKDELSRLASDINSMLVRLVEGQRLEEKNREMSALNTELQRLNELKDEFLANTSHELRTPLNGMIGITESLLNGAAGPLSPEQEYNLTLVTQSGKRLNSLVNDILDFSKLRHHELVLDLKPVNLRAIVEIVLQIDRSLIRNKNLTLVNEIPGELPSVQADENRLQQILHNLIGNAIKFTPSGQVTIRAEVLGSDQIAISVADTGIGIPEDKLDRVFESFEQVEGSARRQYGGTGLGLAITRNLVEMHGGQVTVRSVLGQGSVFTITLPISREQAPAVDSRELAPNRVHLPEKEQEIIGVPPGEDAAKSPVSGVVPHILVVDDEPVNLQVVRNFLKFENYTLTLASDGIEAIALLDAGVKPDILLLDVMMPGMTGYEVVQAIRKKARANQLPIILLSARNNPEDIVMGLEVGANDYLSKPISKEELVARLHTHLQIRQLEEETIRLTIAYERQRAQFLDALPVGVSVHNPDGSVIYRNQRAQDLLQDELLGTVTSDPLSSAYAIYRAGTDTLYPTDQLPVVRALGGEVVQTEDLEIHRADGVVPLEVLGTPILDEAGEVVYAIAAFQDITERKQAARVLADLQEATATRQKLESELSIAAQIQRSMVPEIRGMGGENQRFELAGTFQPARMVGGDLYDFFPLDDDRLCIIIGDVADKGVPAALLMARTLTLFRMLARQTSTPADILQAVNQELCANNSECQFVTLLCGIVQLETGDFRYASAGHDAPLLVRHQSIDFLELETGPAIGLIEDASFPEYGCQLQQDDVIVLYTDGLTEAMNSADDAFSETRLRESLAEYLPAGAARTIRSIQHLHSQFVGDAPQSDDMTILALQFHPSAPFAETMSTEEWTITINSQLTELDRVKQRLEEIMEERHVSRETIDDAQLIVEEVLVNIIHYGYSNEESHHIDLQVSLTPERLRMIFEDRGKPFNPLTEIAEADLSMDDDQRSDGGLGFHLVRALSEQIEYVRDEGKNRLTIIQSVTLCH